MESGRDLAFHCRGRDDGGGSNRAFFERTAEEVSVLRPVLSKIWINKESGFSHYIDVEDRIFSLKKRLWDGMIKKREKRG